MIRFKQNFISIPLLIWAVTLAFPADSQIPGKPSPKQLSNPDTVAVVFLEGIIEYERFWTKIKSMGNFKKSYISDPVPSSSKVLALGPSASKYLKNHKGTVWELFVAGTPIIKSHKIIPYQATKEAWSLLFTKLNPAKREKSYLVFLTSPRLKSYSSKLSLLCKEKGIATKTIVVNNEKNALKALLSIYNKKINTWGIKLAHDLDVITPRVLFLALKIQYRIGIPVFVRTKHEVLAGGIATVEPLMDSTQVVSQLSNKTEGKLPLPQSKLFYNSQALKSLRINNSLFKKIKGQPISW